MSIACPRLLIIGLVSVPAGLLKMASGTRLLPGSIVNLLVFDWVLQDVASNGAAHDSTLMPGTDNTSRYPYFEGP